MIKRLLCILFICSSYILTSCGGSSSGGAEPEPSNTPVVIPTPSTAPSTAPSMVPSPAPSSAPDNTDSDGDGVADVDDQCENTPSGSAVDNLGCAINANPANILVFSKTEKFRHASINAGKNMLQNLADTNAWQITLTENSADFNDSNLAQYDVVIWLNTTGALLNTDQQAAFEDYIEGGGAYVGIHSASDTEYDWPWYGELVGAYFKGHPEEQSALVNIEERSHPSTQHLQQTWTHYDEWYAFQSNPRAQVNVVMSIDESSYSPGVHKMGDHPVAWYHTVGAGRAFYSALGHASATYSDANFKAHIEGAIVWAGQLSNKPKKPPSKLDFESVSLASNINLPMALDISAAGDIYVIGRRGEFYAYENQTLVEKSLVPSQNFAQGQEGGLVGFALDPDFVTNRWAYFHYTHPTETKQVISRIPINQDNTLNFAEQSTLLEYPVQLHECCHLAGDLAFDSSGLLYIATGDNTNPHTSGGYTPIDERSGRGAFDAQKSSSNTNDLRGKILRIQPLANGSYSIPAGNLFSADAEHRGEIFAMGMRNPFRLGVDPKTDEVFWGDIGPDANSSNNNRGPSGYDEINRSLVAGNFGWPYFSGNNEAYNDFDFATNRAGAKFSSANPINESPNNTGAKNLPEAKPAWYVMSHRATMLTDIYRWDNSVTDEFKLPSYFDGRLIYWNFNNDKMFEINIDDEEPMPREWLNTSSYKGIIDAKISPFNQRLYVIGYGGNCCNSPPNLGGLSEVKYLGDIAAEPKTHYSINAGGNNVSFNSGVNYQADNYYSDGNQNLSNSAITNTDKSLVFQSHRYNAGTFSYDLPLVNGDYTIGLEFAETFFNAAGQRIFSVEAEGAMAIESLDLVATAGKNVAYTEYVNVRVDDGELNLRFIPEIENPLISGIRVAPSTDLDVGSYITLNATANQRYIALSTGNLIANVDAADAAEVFRLDEGIDGSLALYSMSLKKYLSVDSTSGNLLSVSADTVTQNESFRLNQAVEGFFSIYALANDKFVAAESAGVEPLVANRDAAGAWEAFTITSVDACADDDDQAGHGIRCRPAAEAYLSMPERSNIQLQGLPLLLSETGAFSDMKTLTPSASLIPFEPIAPLWSDRAVKKRWVSVPTGKKVQWHAEGPWKWPAGTVFVKQFDLSTNEQDSSQVRRLETRITVVQESGLIYGASYKWRLDNSDADLLTESLDENIEITSNAGNWTQTWTYPGPEDCLTCHNEESTGVLGPKTASLNKNYDYASGITENQLSALSHIGLFDRRLNNLDLNTLPKHAHIADESSSLELRVRSYWDVNCGFCHGPQGIAAKWDARFETPLSQQGVIRGELANQRDYLNDYGLATPYVVDPKNAANSILFIRDKSVDVNDRMPPLGRNMEDKEYISVLQRWIDALPE